MDKGYVGFGRLCKCLLSVRFSFKNFIFSIVFFYTSATFGQIKNNYIDYTNGSHGTICATPAENGVANLSAPSGTVFTTVDFASYGTPTGSCESFAINTFCHAAGSQAIAEGYILGNNTASIPATNAVFTDPCVGTVKKLYIQVKYTQPICSGTSPGTITGTTPTGSLLGYQYSWEKSILGPSSGFSAIAGATSKNYTPGNLSQTTWFRRKVSASLASDSYSSVLQVTVVNQPSVSAVTTSTCIGGSTGTITATGSGDFAPYTFNLNSGTYQASVLFTGLASGTYTLGVKNSIGCTGSSSVTISAYPNSTDNQSSAATNSWIGHLYSGMNFNNYIGHFTESETFDEGFGGDYTCFTVSSGATSPSLYTEQFSVRFRMNSTKKGLYIADLGSDDGSRLTVDGTVVYNNWSDQSFSSKSRVLMTLTGSSSLNYEFYENLGANRTVFQNFTKVLGNELTSNTTQSICLGNTGSAISGDTFGTLPSGISLSGTGYQWSYSATPGGTRTDIAGATSATYTPNASAAPFNVAGTYYIYRSAKLSSANNTGVNPYVATNVSNAATITVNAAPAISYTATSTCVGGSTGTITVNGSGSQTPYTYSLSTGAYQANNLFTGLATNTYNINIKSSTGCIASTSATVVSFANSTDNQNETGSNSWIGHLYSGMNFNNYIGHFTESETFDEGFGGDYTCFTVSSGATSPSLYTEQFSVRFRMNSTKKGLYIADLGSDDGSRLTVDGTVVYNNWSDQSFSSKSRVLMTLTGSSSLNYEFYENLGANRTVFQNFTKVLGNELTSNTTQSICLGSTGSVISGDAFGTLPSGILLSGTGYQWSYSATPGGARTDIAGATSATYTPNTSAAPFNVAGTYYIYRSAKLSSANNTGVNPYVATNVSNAATITVNAIPSATISYAGAPFCNTLSNAAPVTISGTPGGQFTAIPSGLSIDHSSGAIVPSESLLGNYTITYTVASAGCPDFTTSRDVYVGAPGTWTGRIDNDWNNSSNWICGVIPGLSTDVVLSKYAANYPAVINGSGAVKNITLQENAFLTVKGALKIAGNIADDNGSINAAKGSIEMSGSSGQIISGSFFDKKTIKNLIVSNTGSGLSVSSAANDTLKISGTLSFGNSNSVLNTGGNMTLVSDSAGTANVGIVGAGNAINGKVIVERYINTGTLAGQHSKSWQFLATPAIGPTIKESWMENGNSVSTGYGTQITRPDGIVAGFDATSVAPSLKYYDALSNSWIGVTNADNPLYNPKGYMVFVRGDRSVTSYNQLANKTTLRIKGTLLTGSLPPISVLPDKWESIGNPYASPVDFTLITKSAGVDDKFYVWDPHLYGSYGLGGYQTLSSSNDWEPVPGGTATYPTGIPCKTIQSGQAFFVRATPIHALLPATYTITFTENCKAGSSSSFNFARYQGQESTVSQRQYLRASLFTGPDGIIADGNVVAFDKSFSDTLDGKDAIKIANSGENFGIKRAGKILSIEAKSPVNSNDTIYFNMSNLKQQTYQLRFAPGNMKNSGLEAFLIDQFLNTSTPVNLSDSGSVNIAITGDPASAAADRFKIVFMQASTENISQDNKREPNSIIKTLVDNHGSFIRVYPNPVTDGMIHLQLTNQPKGTYGIRLLNSLGEKILSKKIIHTAGNKTENIKWNYKLTRGIYRLEITRPGGETEVINVVY